MTSWIDGSFVYSTQEAWVNTMRSFKNGSLKWMGNGKSRLPPYNQQRVPLMNVPSPHVLRRLSPERMFGRKMTTSTHASSLGLVKQLKVVAFSSWRSSHQPEPCVPRPRHLVLPLAQRSCQEDPEKASKLERRGRVPGGEKSQCRHPAGVAKSVKCFFMPSC